MTKKSEPPKTAYDPGQEGATMSFAETMSYGDYLHLGPILSSQKPLSTAHDEMLFIVQHQTSELWMRLVIHELNAVRQHLADEAMPQAFKMLARVARIFDQLNGAWDVLRTMTPSDYTTFRETLGASSGFQSHQYRMIEFMLGNRNPNMLKPFEHEPALSADLQAELERPSLYDDVITLLVKRLDGPDAPCPPAQKDTPHACLPDIQTKWQRVYEDIDTHWELYELAEKLVDLEDYFRRWRFNHVTTVERVIGFKRGTGGTMGARYLKRMLDVVLFPELWNVRGDL